SPGRKQNYIIETELIIYEKFFSESIETTRSNLSHNRVKILRSQKLEFTRNDVRGGFIVSDCE
ncbi:MAG: hypothetical protein V2I33_17690, partial [Kangiellaceae bacterium]|nr:hypothetical protein [Kangiellaceae bacterium]